MYSPYSSRLTYCLIYAMGGASFLMDYSLDSIKSNGLFLAPKSFEIMLVMMVKRGLVSAEFSRKWCLIMAEALACGLLAIGSEKKYV